MAVLPRRPRVQVQALAWLAVVLLLAATSGGLCRNVPVPDGALPAGRALLQSSTPSSPAEDSPPPPPRFPRPICRLCPPRCPPEGCSGTGGGSP